MTQLEKFRIENAELQDKLRQSRNEIERMARTLLDAQSSNVELRRLCAEAQAHKAHADWLQRLTETLVGRVSVEALTSREPSFPTPLSVSTGRTKEELDRLVTCPECLAFLPHQHHKIDCSRSLK